MAHTSSAHPLPSGAGSHPEARELLFKPDHPRAIDRHIDYFGTYEPPGAEEPVLALGAARSAGGRAGD
jgi:hypothetical protein